MGSSRERTFKAGAVLSGKWIILDFIAQGGMGEVYHAHQLNLKRDVAVKVISREWLTSCLDDADELEAGIERFVREVQAMGQIRHKNILKIIDCDSTTVVEGDREHQVHYLVMEYIPGGSLRSTMSEEGFFPEEKLIIDWLTAYYFPILEAVQAMHADGIVHRDLKPENILMDGNEPKIADFGLVRSCRMKPVTSSVDIKGTPAYMSPEHFFEFRRADHRCDIYSLGKILFEAVNGKLGKQVKPFTSVRLESCPTPFFQTLDGVIQKATAANRENRFKSVAALREALLEAIIKTPTAAALPYSPQRNRLERRLVPSQWFIATVVGLGLFAAAIAVMWFYGIALRPRAEPDSPDRQSNKQIDRLLLEDTRRVFRKAPDDEELLLSADEMMLRFVPEGAFVLPAELATRLPSPLKVEPFYMDETQVTNHQYLEFLNQILAEIVVEEGIVKMDGEILLFLGEVMKGYEPIIFKDGRFHISHSGHASCPVLRVTAYGAAVYASYYGKRLPTEAEWLYALFKGAVSGDIGSDRTASSQLGAKKVVPPASTSGKGDDTAGNLLQEPTQRLPIPSPVILYQTNGFGIRGLYQGVGEWGQRQTPAPAMEKPWDTDYLVMGRPSDSTEAKGFALPIKRHPYEAFANVGFRCAVSADQVKK